jgi:hypothetical protein
MNDAAGLSVMIEGIGCRSPRWMQIKREEFLMLEETQRGSRKMPRCVVRQESRLQHAISSLSSSSGSSNHASSSEDSEKRKRMPPKLGLGMMPRPEGETVASITMNGGQPFKVSGSSRSGGSSNSDHRKSPDASKEYHDYHAKPLPDPKLEDSERSSPSVEDFPEESNGSSNSDTKRISTDSSSGDDSAAAIAAPRPTKRKKTEYSSLNGGTTINSSSVSCNPILPPNIAKKGGIPHNVRPTNGTARLSVAPAVALPPFAGIGKKLGGGGGIGSGLGGGTSSLSNLAQARDGSGKGPAVISADVETSSSESNSRVPQIRAYYHINEDDMILMEDVLMCPFVFRSQDAVLCGALAECVMPGMLRAHFTSQNKMKSLEIVYDSMGFMQQLERASGREGSFQIIPGSLEMALSPTKAEARVITTAQSPFLIVNVNELWTRMTGYTQMEVEGMHFLSLLEGEGTVAAASERPGKPNHKLEEVARGKCACSTNIHYDKDGRDFIEFVCSYPLTK